MIYIEPTPYILGLIKEVRKQTAGNLEVIFLKENITQTWNLSNLDGVDTILSRLRVNPIQYLIQKITKNSYQCVHLAGWSDYLVLFVLFFSWFKNIPVAIESDTQISWHHIMWKKIVKRIFYPVLFKFPSVFLPGGSRQAEYFRYYGVHESRICIAQMTVDVSYIMSRCKQMGSHRKIEIRKQLGFSMDEVLFIFVGRLVDWKGIKDLMMAFDGISSLHKSARLLVVGNGPEKEFVEDAVRKNGAIKYMGRLDQEEVLDMYYASDIAVVPSFKEPWGLVVNEAMAAGLPVIVSDQVGCIDDLIQNGKTGLIFPSGDRRALAEAMQKLLFSREERKRMGLNGMSVISGWTFEEEAKRIVASWDTITQVEKIS